MVLDLQRSKTVLQALSPTVQLLKKDMEEEFEIVRQHEKQQLEQERLKKSAVLPQKTPGRKKRGRPKKATVTAPKVDDKTYTIAEKADTAKFLYGSPFCSRCKGELFNLYYKCQGCDKQAENVVLCKECIYSEDITPCPDQTAKQHSPSENDHQCFDVKFRFYHFRQSLGDSSYFKTIQEALAKMRVGLLRTDPVRDDDEANKGIMRAKEQCDTFVQKLMRERRELTKSLEKRSKELALPVYESDAASHLITPTIPVCNDTIDVWRNLLLIREHEKQTTSPGTAASYIFPTSFYTMYDQFGSTEKNRSAYKAFTENWDLPNGQSKPPCE